MQPNDQIAYHLRAAKDIGTKVQRVCGFEEKPLHLPEDLEGFYQQGAKQLRESMEWQNRLKRALGPDATPEQKAAITDEACKSIRRYLESFFLNHDATIHYVESHVQDHLQGRDPENPFYFDSNNRLEQLTELRTNHIANATQASLLQHTDAENTLSLHKYIVSRALDSWIKTDYYAAHVKPFLDHKAGAEGNLQNVRVYAREEQASLHEEYQYERETSHAKRIRAEQQARASSGTSLS